MSLLGNLITQVAKSALKDVFYLTINLTSRSF